MNVACRYRPGLIDPLWSVRWSAGHRSRWRALTAKRYDHAGDHREMQGGPRAGAQAYEVVLPRRREVARIPLWLVPEKTGVPDIELADGEQQRYDDKSNCEHR